MIGTDSSARERVLLIAVHLPKEHADLFLVLACNFTDQRVDVCQQCFPFKADVGKIFEPPSVAKLPWKTFVLSYEPRQLGLLLNEQDLQLFAISFGVVEFVFLGLRQNSFIKDLDRRGPGLVFLVGLEKKSVLMGVNLFVKKNRGELNNSCEVLRINPSIDRRIVEINSDFL